MTRPNWFIDFIKAFYPREPSGWGLTQAPLLGPILRKLLFAGDKMIFLPRNKTIEVNLDVERPDQVVLPSQLVDHYIDQADYHVIMNFCICRESMQCSDYPIDFGCLFIGDAARGINTNWGRPVTKQEARDHIKKCEDAGLIHVIGRARLDTVWLGIGPRDKLMTVCNCCPCCCMFRGAPHMHPEIEKDLIKAPGVEVKIGADCTGCGVCTRNVCFVEAIEMDGDRAVISDQCRGCGRCVEACPTGAIEISIDPDRYISESVEFLEIAPTEDN